MRRILFIGITFILTAQIAFADTFSVQGVLRDPLGKTVPDASYVLDFKLYEAASEGDAIWTETHSSVKITHGVFSVELGSTTALTDVPFDTQYWIGVTVVGSGEAEMTPRFKVSRVPAAMSVYGTKNIFPSIGKIGAGTKTPSAALHIVAQTGVDNDLLIEDASANPKLVVNSSNQVGIGVSSPAAALHIKTADDSDDKLLIQSSTGTKLVTVTSDGKLGIGANAPTQALDIDGNLKMRNGGIMFDDGSTLTSADMGGSASSVSNFGTTLITADSDEDGTGNIDLITGSTTRMTVNSNGNVGIGTSSPGKKLHIYGSGYDPAIHLQHSGATTKWNLGIGGTSGWTTNAFVIDEEGQGTRFIIKDGGNVGIGTTSPSYPLDVSGTARATSFSGSGASLTSLNASNISSGTISDSRLESAISRTSFVASDYITADGGIHVGGTSDPGTDNLIVDGKVGIGTTSPSKKLHIYGSGYDPAIHLQHSGSTTKWNLGIGGTSGWTTNAFVIDEEGQGTRFIIKNGGNVGIGTSSPSEKLDVEGNIELNDYDLKGLDDLESYGNGTLYINYSSTGSINLANGGGDVFLGSSGGDFGIGTSSPSTDLHIKVSSETNAEGGIRLESANDSNYWVIRTDGSDHLRLIYNNTYRGKFDNSSGNYTTGSDIRLKKDIAKSKYGLDEILALNPVEYHFRDQDSDNSFNHGFIAQELELVMPEFVSVVDPENGYKGITYAPLVSVLAKAVQQLNQKVEDLEARLDLMERKQ